MSSRRLRPLVNLSQSKVDSVEQSYAQKNHVVAKQQARLDDLGKYAQEYRATPSGKLSAAAMRNRVAFAGKVEQVLVQQKGHVEQAKLQADAERERLLAARREREALEKIVQARRVRERKAAERKEQIELDELAMRQYRKRQERPKP